MCAVEPGMAVTDARGKVTGHVQELRQTGRGVVETVTVEVGNRVATLPAASFTGSGDVPVTGMTKGQLQDPAEQQDAPAGPRRTTGSDMQKELGTASLRETGCQDGIKTG